jgi:hypothetical protein
MSTMRRMALAMAASLGLSPAAAQTTVGDLLDAGAKALPADKFREEVVQRMVVGPTPSRGTLEVMYTASGTITGQGTHPNSNFATPVSGQWTVDEAGRICSSMRIGEGDAGHAAGVPLTVVLPPRCQTWFKYGNQYFIADSDSDRSARVFSRTLKQ